MGNTRLQILHLLLIQRGQTLQTAGGQGAARGNPGPAGLQWRRAGTPGRHCELNG
jgi:hypothetical protein